MRIAVLVSGTGTIAGALLGEGLPVVAVVADRPCAALDRAAAAGVEAVLVDRRESGGFGPTFDRGGYTRRVVEALRDRDVDLVVMAGFGTVLGEAMYLAFPHRVLNTHPSLLPSHPGWHAVEDALAAGDTVTGCTVHIAELAVDAGPVLAQQEVPVLPSDGVAEVHERIKAVERRLLPATVRRVAAALEAGIDPGELEARRGSLDSPLEAATASEVGR